MAYVALTDLKAHLRVEFDDDNSYLTTLVGVAEDAIERELQCKLSDYEDDNGKLPAALQHAIMILCGDFYNNRESVAFAASSVVPHTFDYLIAPFKKYDSGCSTDQPDEEEGGEE